MILSIALLAILFQGSGASIDGAFSEAYGDHGYTLVLEADRTFLALHHHFESVEAAVRDGVDIIPSVTEVRLWERRRRMADTERGPWCCRKCSATSWAMVRPASVSMHNVSPAERRCTRPISSPISKLSRSVSLAGRRRVL